MSMCSCLLCSWKRVFAMTSACSWQNSVNLCPASFCIPRPNLPVTPGISDFLLLHSCFIQWKEHLSWVLVLEDLVGLHRTIQLQLLQHYWLGHRCGLLWYWIISPGNDQRSFSRFWDCTQHCILDSFVDYDGYCIFSKVFLSMVVNIIVIWVKFTHSSTF